MKYLLLILFALLTGRGVMAAELPRSAVVAQELIALPGGHWLAQEKRKLRLLGAAGQGLDSFAVRGKSLDVRPLPEGARVVVLDADTQETVMLRVDLAQGPLLLERRLPSPAFALESLCLYRDTQSNDFIFMLGKDGRAQQWLLGVTGPVLFRELAVPPEAESCRVDDASNRLFVLEKGFGLWLYTADGEGVPTRSLIAARRPWGTLARGGPQAFAVSGDALGVLDVEGRVHAFQSRAHSWLAGQVRNMSGAVDLALLGEQLAVRRHEGWSLLGTVLHRSAPPNPLPVVQAQVQTEPVARFGDAADDPAIWLHPDDRSQSLVIATNKKQGLLSYDLQGRQRQLLEVGRLNNVDLRQGIVFGEQKVDLAIATQRDERALALFEIDAGTGRLRDAGRIATELHDIYGTCLFRPEGGGLEAFANDKDGRFVHYRIERDAQGAYRGRLLRRFRLSSQPEGCVADDAAGVLFIGEEKRGIWRWPARADDARAPSMIMPVGGPLVADIEGLALYAGGSGRYLIASSQGNSSYVVLDADAPHTYRGAFRIGLNSELGIDAVSDTDGLEVSAVDFGGPFTSGMLVVQDGYKRLPDGAQNFKFVAWRDIARALGLP